MSRPHTTTRNPSPAPLPPKEIAWGRATLIAKSCLRLSLLVLLFTVPIFVMPYQVGGIEMGATRSPAVFSKELLLQCVLAFMLVAGVFYLSSVRWTRQTLLQVAVVGFALSHLVSAAFSGRAHYSFQAAALWVVLILCAWIVSQLRWKPGELRGFLVASVGAGIVVSIYGLMVYFNVDPLRAMYPFQYGDETGRNYVASFIGNPEYLGGYMACLATLCVALALAPEARTFSRVLWLGLALLFLALLLLSGTRGALLGFAGGAVVALMLQVGRLNRQMRAAVLGLCALGAVGLVAMLVVFSTPNVFNKRGVNIVARFASIADLQSASVRERILFYTLSGRMIGENPVWGSGPGGFRLDFYPTVAELVEADKDGSMELTASLLRSRVAENAHNDYLQIWVEHGAVGMFVFLAMVAALISQSLRGLPKVDDYGIQQEARSVEIAALCGVLTLLILATFSFPMRTPERALLLWTLIAVAQSAASLTVQARSLTSANGAASGSRNDGLAADGQGAAERVASA